MLMMGWNEAVDQLSMAYNVCWYGREYCHVLRIKSEFYFEGSKKKGVKKEEGVQKEKWVHRKKCG